MKFPSSLPVPFSNSKLAAAGGTVPKKSRLLLQTSSYEKGLDFNKLAYLKTGKFDWQGRKIMRLLRYKALQKGIATTTVKTTPAAIQLFAGK